MKKIFVGLATAALLFGCSLGGESDDSMAENENIAEVADQSGVVLTDSLFVALSAEILCLPVNNQEASGETIEELAKQILVKAEVEEEDFGIYQKTIEADPASKQEISLAIVGKMAEFCEIETVLDNFAESEDEGLENSVE